MSVEVQTRRRDSVLGFDSYSNHRLLIFQDLTLRQSFFTMYFLHFIQKIKNNCFFLWD